MQVQSSITQPPVVTPTTTAKPQLPLYAKDGRALHWTSDGSGVWFDSTDDEYHSDKVAASASSLKLMNRSPAHLKASRDTKQNTSTAAMEFGTALHCAVLEPFEFGQRYCVYDGVGKTKAAKEYKEFVAQNPCLRVITKGEEQRITDCASQARNTSVIRSSANCFTMQDLVQMGATERVYYWADEETGLTCKARMDLTIENIVIDLKTAQDARQQKFKYDAEKYGYHIQAAFYIEGYRKFIPSFKEPIMLFVVVESEAPYATSVYQADKEDFWMVGKKRMNFLMQQYKQCVQTNHWPAYQTGTQLLKLPLNTLLQNAD